MKQKEIGRDSIGNGIEKKNPLKQGLKLVAVTSGLTTVPDWKEESIKTRIETKACVSQPGVEVDWKEESIKTRIETYFKRNILHYYLDWKEESIKTRIETRQGIPIQSERLIEKKRIH